MVGSPPPHGKSYKRLKVAAKTAIGALLQGEDDDGTPVSIQIHANDLSYYPLNSHFAVFFRPLEPSASSSEDKS